jgi:hypothetical protein
LALGFGILMEEFLGFVLDNVSILAKEYSLEKEPVL